MSFFNQYLTEEAEVAADDIEALLPQDPETTEGVDVLASKVEDLIQTDALEAASYFEGGEEAIKQFMESVEVQAELEAGLFAKKGSFMKSTKEDDLNRRTGLAAVLLAQNKGDALFKKLAKVHMVEKKIKQMIFKKFGKQARKIALASQKKHIKEVKKHPSMPQFKR